MRIVMIGSGNVATVLSRKFSAAGHRIVQVYSRNQANAAELSSELDSSFTSEISGIDQSAELYLVSLSDTALLGISQWLKLDNQLVAHTAGSVSMEILKPVSANYGIFYPLQSMRKESAKLPKIPFLIDGNTTENITVLMTLAKEISDQVQFADDQARGKLHVAAIISNNFTNHLFTLAEDFCIREKVDFNILKPLILESVDRLAFNSPRELQTGPAMRNDNQTIEKQQSLIRDYPELVKIYDLFTKSIQEYYKV